MSTACCQDDKPGRAGAARHSVARAVALASTFLMTAQHVLAIVAYFTLAPPTAKVRHAGLLVMSLAEVLGLGFLARAAWTRNARAYMTWYLLVFCCFWLATADFVLASGQWAVNNDAAETPMRGSIMFAVVVFNNLLMWGCAKYGTELQAEQKTREDDAGAEEQLVKRELETSAV